MKNIEENQKFLDIRKIFTEKNPRLAKVIPNFLFKIIEKIIHQNELNYIVKTNKSKTGKAFLDDSLKYFNLNIVIENIENLPENGRCMFVSNHPLGGIDGLIIIQALANKYGKVKAIVNDILYKIPTLSEFFLPVNKFGSTSRQNALLIEEAFESDVAIFTFPSGIVSRKTDGRIVDPEWKKTFVSKAVQTKRDIVPIYCMARNSNRFYNLGIIRKFFFIKANLEMFLLSDEMFKQKNKTIVLRIGKPIPWQQLDKTKTHNEWAEVIKNNVYKMASATPDKIMYK